MKNMKNLSKRGLALFLTLVMCLSMVQITAFAEGETQEPADGIVQITEDEVQVDAPAQDPEQPVQDDVLNDDGSEALPSEPEADADVSDSAAEADKTPEAIEPEDETAGEGSSEAGYASVDDLNAAFEAVGETDDVDDALAALDDYLALFDKLSPEDQEANADALAAALAYQETLKGSLEGEPDPDIDTLALLTGEEFRIQVNIGYVENGQFVRTGSKTMISNCTYGCGHSGYNHQMSARSIVAAAGYSGADFRVTRYGYWDNAASNTNCNYNITGSAPYKADQAIWIIGDKPTIDPGEVTPPGTTTPGNPSGSGSYYLQVVYVDKARTEYTFGPKIASNTTWRQWYYDNRPTSEIPDGYELVAWQNSYFHGGTGHLLDGFNGRQIGWWGINGEHGTPRLNKPGQYNETIVMYSGDIVYLIYQQTKDPEPATNTFALTYDANGGVVEGKGSHTVSIETTDSSYDFNSLEPTRGEGWEFLGWYTQANGGTEVKWPKTLTTQNPTDTVYAHWEMLPDTHENATVIYMPGVGGDGSKMETVPGSQEYTILSPGAAGITGPEGKVFSHWEYQNTAKDMYFGGDKFTPADRSVNIFVAIWKDDDSQTGDATYTVSWFDEDGNAIPSKPTETRRATLNSPVSVTEADKVVKGYTFLADDNRNLESAVLEKASGTELKLYFRKNPTPAGPALSIEKSVDKTSVKVGSELTYTITVTNDGKADATGVVVKDTLPGELTYVMKSTEGADEARVQGNDLTWELGTVAAGATVEFTFKATAIETGSIKNVAVVTGDGDLTDTSDPVPTAIYSFAVTKKNDGFVSVKGTGKATVHYTVTVTNDGTIPLYGLNIKDVLTPEIKVDNNLATAEQAAMVLQNVEVSVNGKTLEGNTREGNTLSVTAPTTTTWNLVLDRNVEFAPNDVVTLEYDIEVKNLTTQQIYVNLNNTATCGTWTYEDVSQRMKARAASAANDGYVEESASSGATMGSSDTGGTIDPVDPDKVTITVKFVDEDGKTVGTPVEKQFDKNSQYDVTDETTKIPTGYEANGSIQGSPTGTADFDKEIIVPVKKSEDKPGPGPGPSTNNVTITVKFVDENGTVVKTEIKEVEKDSSYDVTEETTKIPTGYEANGSIQGDPTGTADSDKEIIVPVKKTEQDPGTDKVTVTWLNGYNNTPVKVKDDHDKGAAVPSSEYPADPTRPGSYRFTGWGAPVIDADGNITITAQWRYTGGNGGGGGGYTPPHTPDPDPDPEPTPDEPVVDVPDPDVPLVDVPEVDPPLVDIPEEEPPLVELPEEEVPLADVPKTGDRSLLWQMSALLSAVGLMVLKAFERKQDDEA